MKHLKTLIAVTIILFLPLAAQAQKVNVDFDKAIDFSKFKTLHVGHRDTGGQPDGEPADYCGN